MYLDQIVDYVNSTVKHRMGQKASRSMFHGVCKIVDKGEERGVIFYDNAGNDVNVQDDTYHLICYHRFLGFAFQSNEQNANNSFGDGSTTKSAFANFIMGVYGDRQKLELSDQELTASICYNFPDEMPKQLRNQLTGIGSVIISPVSTNNQISTTEPIKPTEENIFFTVQWRAAIIGDASCLSLCNPACV